MKGFCQNDGFPYAGRCIPLLVRGRIRVCSIQAGIGLFLERPYIEKRGRCDVLHRLSYEKDLYKKVRIHCVTGRTLP